MGLSGILVILEVSNYQTVWERKTIRMRRSRSKHGSAPCAATSMSVPSRRRIARSAASRGSISTQSNSRRPPAAVPQVGGGVQTLPAGVAPWCRALEAFCPPEAAIGGGYENNLAGATPSGRPPGPSTLPGPDFLPGPGRLMCL